MAGLSSATVQTNGARIDDGGFSIGISQNLLGDAAGDGGLTKQGLGTLLLNGINTYTNTTTVTAGTLGGNGYIAGPVVVQASGTLTAGASIGTLHLLNNLTLAGNVFAEVNKSVSPSNDLVQVVGALINTGTGTVTVTNLGPALVVGDSFKLFSQPVLNGNALTVVSSGGVVWNNKLAVDGSVQVLSVSGAAKLPTGWGDAFARWQHLAHGDGSDRFDLQVVGEYQCRVNTDHEYVDVIEQRDDHGQSVHHQRSDGDELSAALLSV